MIAYHYNANYIRAIPIKNWRGATITKVWEELHHDFKQAKVALNTYVLDSKKSKDLIESFEEQKTQYQLVLLYKYRNTQAERAIQTFKSHFKACLAGADLNFPLSK